MKTLFMIQACVEKDGETTFDFSSNKLKSLSSSLKTESAKKDLQRIMFEAYGGFEAVLPGHLSLSSFIEGGDELDDDDFPEMSMAEGSFIQSGNKLSKLKDISKISIDQPSAPTKNKAGEKSRGRKCPAGAKPNCPPLLDKMAKMKGELLDLLNIKTKELEAHNTECDRISAELNGEITTAITQLGIWNVELAKATATLSSLPIEQNRQQKIKHELCNELREKYKECYTELKELQQETCGLIKIRQAVYNRVKTPAFKPGDPQMMIVDCQMGDWVVGPCSSTCVDANGNPGVQLITRSPVVKWDPTTAEGKYGASCPPNQVERACSDVPCPIDCEMGEWSGWSKCSKDCGGGQQGRSRPVMTEAMYGGKQCPGTSEERLCNSGSCDVDCELTDWSGWSPCTKSCKWRSTAKPGSQKRTKGIAVAAKGNGKCPKPKTRMRYQHQACNNMVCPKDIKCKADADVVLLIDGSGSLYYRYRPIDRNWKLSQKFTKDLISMSKLAKMDADGRAKGGLRYGVASFSWGAKVISPLSVDKAALISKVDGAKWARGWTMTDKALLKAKSMFMIGGTKNRQQIVVLVTDGRASNRWKARKAAGEVRAAGIRVILVPVKNGIRMEKEMCLWASKPCNENMIKTPSWRMLISKLRWYLTTLCPVIEAA